MLFKKKKASLELQAAVQPISFLSLSDEYNNIDANTNTNSEHQLTSYNSNNSNTSTFNVGSIASLPNVPPAVRFVDVCLCVNNNNNSFRRNINNTTRVDILKKINFCVPQGCIYGLLGPSSCGKTTLLRCLVGLLEHTSGSVELFGKQVTNRQTRLDARVPGKNVGYMPQELGLYDDFTIRQMLSVFGGYVGLSKQIVNKRIEFMASFLELPSVERQIGTLSGGQKRRVSFAVACLHQPRLIILDEPTVGVDPLLRQSIWKYLRRLAEDEQTSIIITTHYIEEAAQADYVGLMRAGELLVEDSPQALIASHNCTSLESAFLKICSNVDLVGAATTTATTTTTSQIDDKDIKKLNASQQLRNRKQQQQQQNISSNNNNNYNTVVDKIDINQASNNINDNNKPKTLKLSYTNNTYNNNSDDYVDYKQLSVVKRFQLRIENSTLALRSILYKNFKRNCNSIPLVIFQFLLPVLQMVSFSLCVGGKPSNIGLGIVNKDRIMFTALPATTTTLDLNSSNTETTTTSIDFSNLNSTTLQQQQLLSNKFISMIDTTILTPIYYQHLDAALRDVQSTKLWAVISFGENFTETLQSRFDVENVYSIDASLINQSIISLYADKADKIIDMICERSLSNSFRRFLSLEFEQFSSLPVQIKQVIFDISPNLISASVDGYTESIAAGLLASLTYIMAAGLTTFVMVLERRDGILERTYTTGLNPCIYLLAHAFFRSLVMSIQLMFILFLTFGIIRQPLVGSALLTYIILMLLNCAGISFGLVVSSLCADQNGAALAIVSSLCLKLTLSGILWPLEAVPKYLRVISFVQPLTMPVAAIKQITLKGRGFEDKFVCLGLISSLVWMTVFLAIASRKFKFYQH